MVMMAHLVFVILWIVDSFFPDLFIYSLLKCVRVFDVYTMFMFI